MFARIVTSTLLRGTIKSLSLNKEANKYSLSEKDINLQSQMTYILYFKLKNNLLILDVYTNGDIW